MPRFLAVVALAASLLLIVVEMVTSLTEHGPVSREATEGGRPEPGAGLPRAQDFRLKPQVPVPMPDLLHNYLFTEERSLEGVELPEEPEEDTPAETGPQIALDSIVYQGSIIAGTTRLGLVAYSEQAAAPTPARPPVGRRSRQLPAPPLPAAEPSRPAGEQQFARLREGESLGDLRVAAIQPEKIVFEKDGERHEKPLYD
ncbi:MAG: hypothetical protein AB1634_09955, partial [Thermodesulfobacteriota bacterium]